MTNSSNEPSSPNFSNRRDSQTTERHFNPQSLPVSVVQQMYYVATGKTDKILHSTSDPLIFTLHDIKQLKIRLDQHFEQYKVIAGNISIAVSYKDDQKNVFNEWSKFLALVESRSSVITEITISYSTLIEHAQGEKYPNNSHRQRYQTEISMYSRTVLLEGDSFGKVSRFLKFGFPTLRAEVEYVDFVIANGIMSCIKEWLQTLDKSVQPVYMNKLQNYSHFFSFYFINFALIVGAIPCYVIISDLISRTQELQNIAFWMIVSGVILVFLRIAAHTLAEICEHFVDQIAEVSHILVTKADKESAERINKNNRNNLIKAGFSFAAYLVQLSIAGASSKISDVLFG